MKNQKEIISAIASRLPAKYRFMADEIIPRLFLAENTEREIAKATGTSVEYVQAVRQAVKTFGRNNKREDFEK